VNINNYISEAFQRYGYSMPNFDEEVNFLPLNLWITGKLDFTDESNKENIHARLIIKTRHDELFPDGIFEYAYGWGIDIKEAIINAAFRWIESDFNVFHDLLCKATEHDHSANKMELISISSNKKTLGWEVIFGPLIYTELRDKKLELKQNEIFIHLFDLISASLLFEKGVFGIKVFVMKKKNGELEIDCRLNCHAWEEGKMELEKFIHNWDVFNESHWRKQYILIVDKNLEEIKNKEALLEKLNASLEEQLKTKNRFNWKFWKRSNN